MFNLIIVIQNGGGNGDAVIGTPTASEQYNYMLSTCGDKVIFMDDDSDLQWTVLVETLDFLHTEEFFREIVAGTIVAMRYADLPIYDAVSDRHVFLHQLPIDLS